MNFWNIATIFAALDAGILSVQAEYNRQYRNGVAIYGPSTEAHVHAAQATLIAFRTAENYSVLVREDALVSDWLAYSAT